MKPQSNVFLVKCITVYSRVQKYVGTTVCMLLCTFRVGLLLLGCICLQWREILIQNKSFDLPAQSSDLNWNWLWDRSYHPHECWTSVILLWMGANLTRFEQLEVKLNVEALRGQQNNAHCLKSHIKPSHMAMIFIFLQPWPNILRMYCFSQSLLLQSF